MNIELAIANMVWVLSCYTNQHKSVSIMNTFCRHGLSNSVLSLVNDDTHQEGGGKIE
jgi:hypothetical protein